MDPCETRAIAFSNEFFVNWYICQSTTIVCPYRQPTNKSWCIVSQLYIDKILLRGARAPLVWINQVHFWQKKRNLAVVTNWKLSRNLQWRMIRKLAGLLLFQRISQWRNRKLAVKKRNTQIVHLLWTTVLLESLFCVHPRNVAAGMNESSSNHTYWSPVWRTCLHLSQPLAGDLERTSKTRDLFLWENCLWLYRDGMGLG